MKNKILKNAGMTLVELLSSFTLLTIVGILVTSVLFSGLKIYERTMEEARLRDEADIIMTHFINEFFTLKTSDIRASNEKFIEKTNGKITGFKDAKVYINDEEIKSSDSNIKIGSESVINDITKNGEIDDVYEVVLVLKSKKTGQTLKLRSVFRIIQD